MLVFAVEEDKEELASECAARKCASMRSLPDVVVRAFQKGHARNKVSRRIRTDGEKARPSQMPQRSSMTGE